MAGARGEGGAWLRAGAFGGLPPRSGFGTFWSLSCAYFLACMCIFFLPLITVASGFIHDAAQYRLELMARVENRQGPCRWWTIASQARWTWWMSWWGFSAVPRSSWLLYYTRFFFDLLFLFAHSSGHVHVLQSLPLSSLFLTGGTSRTPAGFSTRVRHLARCPGSPAAPVPKELSCQRLLPEAAQAAATTIAAPVSAFQRVPLYLSRWITCLLQCETS